MPPDLDDTATGRRKFDGGNGHTHRGPEWGDREAEFVPLPYLRRRRSFWGWLMSTRPMRAAASEVDTSRRPTVATVMMFAGLFMWMAGLTLGAVFWGGDMNRAKNDHDRAIFDLQAHDRENASVRKELTEAQTKLRELYTYEVNLREKMASGQYHLKDLPEVPPVP